MRGIRSVLMSHCLHQISCSSPIPVFQLCALAVIMRRSRCDHATLSLWSRDALAVITRRSRCDHATLSLWSRDALAVAESLSNIQAFCLEGFVTWTLLLQPLLVLGDEDISLQSHRLFCLLRIFAQCQVLPPRVDQLGKSPDLNFTHSPFWLSSYRVTHQIGPFVLYMDSITKPGLVRTVVHGVPHEKAEKVTLWVGLLYLTLWSKFTAGYPEPVLQQKAQSPIYAWHQTTCGHKKGRPNHGQTITEKKTKKLVHPGYPFNWEPHVTLDINFAAWFFIISSRTQDSTHGLGVIHCVMYIFFFFMASISWVADSPLWRMFSRFVFALVGSESSSSNTVASTADLRLMSQESHHRAVVAELIWWRPLHAMSPQGVWYGIVDFEMALGRYPQVLHPLPMAATVRD